MYQHCSEKHLHRYLSEFDFRYSHRVPLGYSRRNARGDRPSRYTRKEAYLPAA